jgi:hypothetical protein
VLGLFRKLRVEKQVMVDRCENGGIADRDSMLNSQIDRWSLVKILLERGTLQLIVK